MSLEDVGKGAAAELPFLPGAIDGFHETRGSAVERERRLAATYENAGIGIIEIDAEGKLLRVNAHLRSLLGYSEQELLGRCLFDLTHPDDAVVDRKKYRQQVAGTFPCPPLHRRGASGQKG